MRATPQCSTGRSPRTGTSRWRSRLPRVPIAAQQRLVAAVARGVIEQHAVAIAVDGDGCGRCRCRGPRAPLAEDVDARVRVARDGVAEPTAAQPPSVLYEASSTAIPASSPVRRPAVPMRLPWTTLWAASPPSIEDAVARVADDGVPGPGDRPAHGVARPRRRCRRRSRCCRRSSVGLLWPVPICSFSTRLPVASKPEMSMPTPKPAMTFAAVDAVPPIVLAGESSMRMPIGNPVVASGEVSAPGPSPGQRRSGCPGRGCPWRCCWRSGRRSTSLPEMTLASPGANPPITLPEAESIVIPTAFATACSPE